MKLSKPQPRFWIYGTIAFISIILALFLGFSDLFRTLELNLVDLRFRIRGTIPVNNSPIVIIAIDDQSDESTPSRWPWPRSYFARVVENLEEAGVKAIGLDVLFDEADQNGPEHDAMLAEILQRYDNIVLTGKLERTSDVTTGTIQSLVKPYKTFLTGATTWGLVSIEADGDGFYRRYHAGQTFNDSLLPSFAAELIRKSLPADQKTFYEDGDDIILGNYRIPKIDAYSMMVNYSGPARTFAYYSFDNILDDADFDLLDEYDTDAFDTPGDSLLGLPPGLKFSAAFKDKIVLIGSTMQELHDNFPTPFLEYRSPEGQLLRAEMPGVEIHANAIQTILTGNHLKSFSFTSELLILLALALVIYFSGRYLNAALNALIVLGVFIIYLVLSALLFIKGNLILNITTPTLVILFGYSAQLFYHFILTQREKTMLRGVFAYYVPEKVIHELINNPEKLTLGGEERVVTVLFSDVAGFTSISEMLKPSELVLLLNEYLTAMTEVILKNNGIIDKFEGDAIMAEFGVPVSFPDHARAACKAALDMQKELRKLRVNWKKQNRPELYARVGINTGEMVVGNMGSRDVFDYTVMGDHVNLGARLESANKPYGTDIMISEFTYSHVKDDFYTRPLDLIRVKGKQKPIQTYELIAERNASLSPKFAEFIEVYHIGIIRFEERDWEKAVDCFDHCLKLMPDDIPAKIYMERCQEFRYNPPPADWDGVITMKEK
jgi:adenylate cyclase